MRLRTLLRSRKSSETLNFEVMRQKGLLKKGIIVKRETRHWDELRRITVSLRSKEEEQDYRYFPRANLVPIVLSKEFLNKVRTKMPELPDDKLKRLVSEHGLPRYDAGVLVGSKVLADFFEECVKLYDKPKEISNWIMSDLLRSLYENNLELEESKITPQKLVEMIQLIHDEIISGKIAKKILPEIILTGKRPKKSLKIKD